ncbi:hypothetical protein ARMSODRAFT_1052985 [Armillaria solidipes]|uniref:Uncharacterized protein n=1 Tax=Armillaria solidipes TaxID=1076256 RepID=A0A2H3B873_9AGAR|nr:hypothetical protein ARMSODRAFT_1052985 [Armillaria solidipes]
MASRLKDTFLSKYRKNQLTLLEKTWEYMDEHMGTNFTIVDIDLEAHEIFEFRLFSQSEEAGVAGNQQWGLDVGCHQDNWYPYSTDHDDDYRFGTESEVEPGPHYVYEDGTTHEIRMKEPRKRSATREPKDYSKPRPRPILKKRRQI